MLQFSTSFLYHEYFLWTILVRPQFFILFGFKYK